MKRQAREVYGFLPQRPSRAPLVARLVLGVAIVTMLAVITWPA